LASSPSAITPSIGTLAAPEPARLPWQRLLAILLSLALLVSLGMVLREEGVARLRGALPTAPIFWLAFGAYYLALPTSEWIIYRRLWQIPGSAFAALLRKLVSNEMLLGYSGELSFYLYARRKGFVAASPFGAIKDVSIMSAMAGNIATLAMVAMAWPIWRHWRPGALPSGSAESFLLLVAACALLLVLRRRIFSLAPTQLRFIGTVHLTRVSLTTLLLGILWTAALPSVPVTTWIALAALHLVVTRLPLVPNKDIVFAGAAMWMVGAETSIGTLMALIASLLVATHLVVGLSILLGDLIGASDAS
jgi:hypothetical protein